MNKYPSDDEARRDIVEAGRRMYQRGYASANDGNISALVSDAELWVTPSGVSKGFMTADTLIKLRLDGTVLEGAGKPSSEIEMHLAIYRASPDILAVTHAHPPVATAFAAAGIPLDKAILQETVVLLGVIPVAKYAIPGSRELAEGVASYCRGFNGALLEHHGAVSWGRDVMQAYSRLESIEYTATVTMYSKMMGITRTLSDNQIDELLVLRPKWGVTSGGRPLGEDEK